MLDFVKELMPLLEGAKDGAIWLIAAYFGLLAMKMLLIAGVILLLGKWVLAYFKSRTEAIRAYKMSGHVRRFEHYVWTPWKDGVVLFDNDQLYSFLYAASDENGYISKEKFETAAEAVREKKA